MAPSLLQPSWSCGGSEGQGTLVSGWSTGTWGGGCLRLQSAENGGFAEEDVSRGLGGMLSPLSRILNNNHFYNYC